MCRRRPAATALLALTALVACGATPPDTGSTGPLAVIGAASLRPLTAGFVLVDGVYNTELTAPFDVFQHTSHHTKHGIEVFTVSPDGGVVTTAEGLRIQPDHSFETAPFPDILVVPSAENSRGTDRQNEELVAWVSRAGEQAGFVMSLCWGAFILAEADLLEGRAFTTFPSDYRSFAEAFPDLDLRVNVSFVHDDKAITSQGGARSYDAAMYLVDLLYGEATASGVGAGLLIPWPPNPVGRPSFISDPRFSLESRER